MITSKYMDTLSSSKLQMTAKNPGTVPKEKDALSSSKVHMSKQKTATEKTTATPKEQKETLLQTPHKRTILETHILSAVELPLLTRSLNETRMNSKDVEEYQGYINGRKCK